MQDLAAFSVFLYALNKPEKRTTLGDSSPACVKLDCCRPVHRSGSPHPNLIPPNSRCCH
ncbi:Uncharacterised protein [Vibrio cholerae]|nr:Uncharacterised protein [Vibrio cholerae]